MYVSEMIDEMTERAEEAMQAGMDLIGMERYYQAAEALNAAQDWLDAIQALCIAGTDLAASSSKDEVLVEGKRLFRPATK